MKFSGQMSVAVAIALLSFLCTVDWIVGKPHGHSSEESKSSESAESGNGTGPHAAGDQPAADQGMPFKEYQNESKNYMVIDDMIIKKDPSRAGLVNANWPEGMVPFSFQYTISPNQRPAIMQAMNEIAAVTCIKFRPAASNEPYNIEFRNDPMNQGCSSFVGWQNRKNQPVQLAAICTKGNAVHEIMHALGFFHEQTRTDRDEYVTVNYQNIQPGYENNFKKDNDLYPDAETSYFDVPYNYDSIMHYGKTYFSKNGQNTIDVLNNPNATGSGENVGQRDYISEGDIQMMRRKYDCPVQEEGASTEGPIATEAPTHKTTTPSAICQVNPTYPGCKTKKPDQRL